MKTKEGGRLFSDKKTQTFCEDKRTWKMTEAAELSKYGLKPPIQTIL